MHELLIRLSAGEDVVNDVIVHEITLTQKLAKRFQISYPTKQMDIMSVALLALVHGVNQLKGQVSANMIEPFLNTRIRTSIITFLSMDKLIPVPRGTRYDAEKRGEQIVEVVIYRIDSESTDAECSHHTGSSYEIKDDTYCQMMAGAELREYFDCVLNERDKEILDDRLQGLSLQEIAKSHGITRQYVGQILNQIREKCNAISPQRRRQDTLPGCGILQRSEDTSEEVVLDQELCGSCAP